ncbi:taurine ABC transporter substrate-binding protein, partial [bacterium M00.F.Ca.ET.152.01.1.1]
MSILSRRILLLSSAAALAGAALLGPASAEDLKITIGYQTA